MLHKTALGTARVEASAHDYPIVVPGSVSLMLRKSLDDLRWIAGTLDKASDVEWVSDVAALYRLRLAQVKRMVLAVDTRVREAAAAVRLLEAI